MKINGENNKNWERFFLFNFILKMMKMSEVWDLFLVVLLKILEIGNWFILSFLAFMHLSTFIIFIFNINKNTLKNVKIKNPLKKSLGLSILIGTLLLWIVHVIFGYFLDQIGFIIIIFLDILLPSVFGLIASTNVGVNVGLNGVSFGFIFYSISYSNNLSFWSEKSWAVFVITIASFIAGWFGGWIAKGQYKHSFTTSVFEVEAICPNSEIRSCSQVVINSIKQIILEIYKTKYGGRIKYLNGNYFETTDLFITNTKITPLGYHTHKEDFFISKSKIRILEVLKEFFLKRRSKELSSLNYILDGLYNYIYYIKSHVLFIEGDKLTDDDRPVVIVSTFAETPSIIWRTDDSDLIAEEIHKKLAGSIPENEPDLEIVLKPLSKDYLCIVKSEEKKLPLEVVSKYDVSKYKKQNNIVIQKDYSKIYDIIKDFMFPKTFFMKVRNYSRYILFFVNLAYGVLLSIFHTYIIGLIFGG